MAKAGSGFKVQGSRFRVQGSGSCHAGAFGGGRGRVQAWQSCHGVVGVLVVFLVLVGPSWAQAGDKSVGEPGRQPAISSPRPLLDYKFTNERGKAVSLNDFRGQALGITFFFTRCPNPNYCPRLSRNFQDASEKLAAMKGGPTNWHFVSVTFDPQYDTPAVLKSYARSYQADPARWNFLTGPPDKIAELAKGCGVTFEPDSGLINHNFRTLIIDAQGKLQTSFPVSGDLSDAIVKEMVKAAALGKKSGPESADAKR
ncbi:MAG: hypothetical protein C5B50_04845 [Verrucomicrobia bacterium]|nr:MAG: hypothetical protein C5B50_04845 [Verrucomicrobiota bacterium]